MYRFVIEERKKWDSVAASKAVAIERNKKKQIKGRCPLCLGEEDVKHMLLDCLKNRSWRMKFLNEKWLNTKKEVDYRKV